MKRLLFATSIFVSALAVLPTAGHADVLYTLDSTNDFGTSGTGPYAAVNIHLVNPITAQVTFTRLGSFVFGEMGLDINASTFGISGLSFTLAPSSNQTPTYTVVLGGKVGGIGNFALDYSVNPNGFTDAVTRAFFVVTDTSGTFADEGHVLNDTVPEAAVHAFTSTGSSFYASGGPTTCEDSTGCGLNQLGVPEPASFALLGAGAFATVAFSRRRRS